MSAGDFQPGDGAPPRCAGWMMEATLIAAVLLATAWATTAQAARIEDVRSRGHLTCGVLPGVAGFAERDDQGRWSGFEIDFCRALAAAIVGDPERVRFIVVRTVDQLARQSDVDVVSRRLTWTLRREAENDLLFGPVIFYDGAGFLVRKSSHVRHATELSGRPLCVPAGSEANRALIDWTAAGRLELEEVPRGTLTEAAETFFDGHCDALVADVSELAAARAGKGGARDDYVILPERISKEPLSLLVRQGDDDFFLVVRWTVLGLIAAEEAGITSDDAASPAKGAGPLDGGRADLGEGLGLDPDWLLNVVRTVGNYGEIYDRHLGPGSAIGLERGLNELWTRGGLMYAPPLH